MPATYEPIQTVTVSNTSTNTVTFSSISQAYTDLIVVFRGGENSGVGIQIRINSDTNTNYSQTRLTSNGSTVSAGRRTSTSTPYIDDGITFDNNVGNNSAILHFMNYSSTSMLKTWLQRMNNAGSGVGTSVGLWRSTSAITRLDFIMSGDNFMNGSIFTLYGVKAA